MNSSNTKAIISNEVEIEIPFYDVDAMKIVWHGHYIKYFEVARCALLGMLNYDYEEMEASGYAWPVIDVNVRYIKPLKFKQKIIVNASIIEYENRLKIRYMITDKLSGIELTKGHTTQVAVRLENNELCFASPQVFLEILDNYSVGVR